MTDGLPLVFVVGERAVCHAVDPRCRAGELGPALALYFAPGTLPGDRLAWLREDGPRALDPALPIGDQVPADAEIGPARA